MYDLEVDDIIFGEMAGLTYHQLNEMEGKNPFLAALPSSNIETLLRKMVYCPPINERERSLPSHVRVHCVEKLREWIQPWSTHKNLAEIILCIIGNGYIYRNPLAPEYILKTRMKNLLSYNTNSKIMTPIVASLIGISGTGKSIAVERILSTHYPQVIKHSVSKEKCLLIDQLVWLKIDCPHNPTIKTFCIQILSKMDQILDTSYLTLFSRQNEDDLMIQVVKILWLHGLGLLVVDEIQQLTMASNKAKLTLQVFLKKMCNVTGIPILLIGTPLALSVISDTFLSNFLRWDRLDDEDWKKLMCNLFKYQWTSESTEFTSYISSKLYENSLGIVDIAIKIYISAQQYCINRGIHSLTPEIITLVSLEKNKLIQPMIYALRNGFEKGIKHYPDLVF
jgi:hypothetical protein